MYFTNWLGRVTKKLLVDWLLNFGPIVGIYKIMTHHIATYKLIDH